MSANDIQILILCAGKGVRLKTNLPKSLIKISDDNLLDHHLKNCSTLNLSPITLITGFRKDLFNNYNLKTIFNPRWNSSNMVHSLFLAKDLISTCKTIVLYGDIAISSGDLRKLVVSNKDFDVLFDLDWKSYWLKRFENPLEDLESFQIGPTGVLKKIGGKADSLSQIQGQYIGAFSLTPAGAAVFFNTWQSMENMNVASVTEVMSKIIENGSMEIHGTPLYDPWLEIDFPRDIEIAKNIIKTIPT